MRLRNTAKNRRGAGMVEYGLVVGLIAVGAIVALERTGGSIHGLLNTVAVELGGVNNTVSTTATDAPLAAPTGCDVRGEVCDQGLSYAGTINSPDGNNTWHLYVAGPETEVQRFWSHSSTTVTGVVNYYDGEANTAALVDYPTGGPYDAALYCDGLNAHGYDDWYLPARLELNHVYNTPKTGEGWLNEHYMTSTESSAEDMYSVQMMTGEVTDNGNKKWNRYFRCVRRDTV